LGKSPPPGPLWTLLPSLLLCSPLWLFETARFLASLVLLFFSRGNLQVLVRASGGAPTWQIASFLWKLPSVHNFGTDVFFFSFHAADPLLDFSQIGPPILRESLDQPFKESEPSLFAPSVWIGSSFLVSLNRQSAHRSLYWLFARPLVVNDFPAWGVEKS